MGWLSALHALKLVVNFFVGVYVTRYLGPERLGALSYATSLTLLFTPLALRGLQNLVTRELNLHPEDAPKILGSTILLKSVGSVLAFTALMLTVIFWTRAERPEEQLLVAVVAASLFSYPLLAVGFWFSAKTRPQPVVVMEGVAFLLTAILKALAVWRGASLLVFGALYTFELLLAGLLMLVLYRRFPFQISWPSRYWNRYLLVYGSKIVLISMGGIIQGYIDQVMIEELLGEAVLGQYALAFRVVLMLAFVTGIVQRSVLPNMLEAKKNSHQLFIKKIRSLYGKSWGLALFLGVLLFLAGKYALTWVYGQEYAKGGELLMWFSAYYLLLFTGSVKGIFLICERLYNHTLLSSLTAALVNVLANLYLIPRVGVEGAIWATYLSMFVGYVLVSFFQKETRRHVFEVLRGHKKSLNA